MSLAFASAPLSAEQARVESIDYQAVVYDLGRLDLERRKVIADLSLHYTGW